MNSRRLSRPAANASTTSSCSGDCRAADLVQLGIVHRPSPPTSTGLAAIDSISACHDLAVQLVPPARPRCCVGTVLAAFPTVNERAWPRPTCAILRACASPRIRLDRLILPLDPPFPAAWDPVPAPRFAATIVRVETDEGVVGIGSGDTMDGFEAFEHLFVGQDPLAIARHVRVLETIDFHAGRYWPLEAALWDIVGQVAGLPVATLFGGATDGPPGLCLVRDAAAAGGARRVRAPASRRGLPGAQDPGRSAPARGGPRGGRGDAGRGRRLDGDHGRPQPGLADGRRHDAPRSTRSPPARSPPGSPSYDVLWLEEPLAGTDLRRPGGAAGVGARGPHRRRRDDPDVRRAAGRARGRRVRRPPARRRAGRRDVADADARRARARAQPLVHAAHLDERHRPAGQPRRSRPASAAGRSSSSRTTRPAGPPERRDFMLAEPVRVDATGCCASRRRPGSASSSTNGRCGVSPPE